MRFEHDIDDMTFDVYGEPLAEGHCIIHPNVKHKFPCSACLDEREKFEQMRLKYLIERERKGE